MWESNAIRQVSFLRAKPLTVQKMLSFNLMPPSQQRVVDKRLKHSCFWSRVKPEDSPMLCVLANPVLPTFQTIFGTNLNMLKGLSLQSNRGVRLYITPQIICFRNTCPIKKPWRQHIVRWIQRLRTFVDMSLTSYNQYIHRPLLHCS